MFEFKANKKRTLMEIFFNDSKIGEVEKIDGIWCWRLYKDGFIEKSGNDKDMDACRNKLIETYKKQ